jgi:putative membrane protein
MTRAPDIDRAPAELSEERVMYWGDGGHMDDGWDLAMVLGTLGFWALVTAALGLGLVWFLRPSTSSTGPAAATNATSAAGGRATSSAEQILAERLARGEIDPEEYRIRVDALSSTIRQ